jgi:SAM-dependent methyltransferase
MPQPTVYDYVRYLHAKRTVDDRALNRGVLAHLRAELADLPPIPRVLELGAGAGTMVTRLADIGWIRRARYTLVDNDAAHLAAASDHLRAWAGPALAGDASGADPAVVVRDGARDLEVDLVAADVFAWAQGGSAGDAADIGEPYDLVIANAFLDIVDVPALLPVLWRRLLPGRPFWFSINFDGETIFLPELPLDGAVMALYHAGMDQRVGAGGQRAGESKTGRHLLQHLPASGARILDAGGSDWVVWPAPAPSSSSSSTAGARGYPADEAYFLHHIVHTIDGALRGAPTLPAAEFAAWIDARHVEIERGELIYIAHQLDVVGRAPAQGASAGNR